MDALTQNEVVQEMNEVEEKMNEVEEEKNKIEEADEVEKEVDTKVDLLDRDKECKVKKTSVEHEVSTSQRRKIPCPLLTCKAKVVHLPRHIQNVHHWAQEAASKVLLKYYIRRRLKKDSVVCHSVV